MNVLVEVTSGWTGRLGPFTLKSNGTPINLTGLTVKLVLRSPDGSQVTIADDAVTIANQTTNPGQVYWDPVDGDLAVPTGSLQRSLYRLHFTVTDTGGKIVSFPNGDADAIAVYRV